MERLSITNINTNNLTREINKYSSVKELNEMSTMLLSKYKTIDEIEKNISDISLDNFKTLLSEVNELSSTINEIFKKELNI